MKPPLIIVVAMVINIAICASLGWIGVTEHHLITGGMLGIKTSDGLSAVIVLADPPVTLGLHCSCGIIPC